MSSEIQDILDECIDRISMKGESLEDCLRDYSDKATELRSLLQVAHSLSEMAAIEPRPAFKAEARYRLHMAMSQRRKRSIFSISAFGWQRRWAPAVATLVALFVIGGGAVSVASGSLPGDALYGVKIATENAQLAMTPSEASRVMLHVSFADNRIREMTALAETGRPASMADLIQRLNRHLATVEESAATGAMAEGRVFSREERERLSAILEMNAIRHMAVLENVMERAPEQARPSLQQAVAVSQHGYETALSACGGNLEKVRGQWGGMRRQIGRGPQTDTGRPESSPISDEASPPALQSGSEDASTPLPGMGPAKGPADWPRGQGQTAQPPLDTGAGTSGARQAPSGMGPGKSPGRSQFQTPAAQASPGTGQGMGRGMGSRGRP